MSTADEAKLCGNVALVGFENLDEAEQDSIKKIVASYVKKLCEVGNLTELRLILQQHPHGKSFKHEIQGVAFMKKERFAANAMEWNVFKGVSEVCHKIFSAASHKKC